MQRENIRRHQVRPIVHLALLANTRTSWGRLLAKNVSWVSISRAAVECRIARSVHSDGYRPVRPKEKLDRSTLSAPAADLGVMWQKSLRSNVQGAWQASSARTLTSSLLVPTVLQVNIGEMQWVATSPRPANTAPKDSLRNCRGRHCAPPANRGPSVEIRDAHLAPSVPLAITKNASDKMPAAVALLVGVQ